MLFRKMVRCIAPYELWLIIYYVSVASVSSVAGHFADL